MWTILGQPAAGIAVPYWPVGSTPEAADGDMTAPLCDAANAIRALLFDTENNKLIDTFKLRDKKGEGLWAHLFPAEEYIFNATKPLLEKWRKRGPSVEKMLAAEAKFSNYALAKLREAHKILLMEN